MSAQPARRTVVAGVVGVLLTTPGCLFGSAHRGDAERVVGEVVTDADATQTVTVRLERPDGGVDFERTMRIAEHDTVEFEVEDPAQRYELGVSVVNGQSRRVEWDVSPCTNGVTVGISDEIEFSFTAC